MLIRADARFIPLADNTVQTVVTSPPYFGLRDYGAAGQIGLERMPEEYVANMVQVFREIRRVLLESGTIWLNLGDSYSGSWGNYHPNSPPGKHGQRVKESARWNRPAYQSQEFLPPTATVPGLKPKDMIGIPWTVAFALRADGWYLRSDIIWAKSNPMPESVTDRPTKAHEYIFLLSKSEKYFFDQDAVREPFKEGSVARAERNNTGTAAPGQQPHSGICGPRWKTPDGWDTSKGNGGHGSFHREGREAGKTGYIPKSHRGSTFNNGKKLDTHPNIGTGPREDHQAGRNIRTVWEFATQPYSGAHFATFPEAIPERCILAGSRPGDLVLDPFCGSGTTCRVAERLNRRWVGLDLKYQELSTKRTVNVQKELLETAQPP